MSFSHSLIISVGQPTVGAPTTLFLPISYTKHVGAPYADAVNYMRLVDAVYARIIELVKERQITVNALANLSGVPRPTGWRPQLSTPERTVFGSICVKLARSSAEATTSLVCLDIA